MVLSFPPKDCELFGRVRLPVGLKFACYFCVGNENKNGHIICEKVTAWNLILVLPLADHLFVNTTAASHSEMLIDSRRQQHVYIDWLLTSCPSLWFGNHLLRKRWFILCALEGVIVLVVYSLTLTQ